MTRVVLHSLPEPPHPHIQRINPTSITTASIELDHERSQEKITNLSGLTALPEMRAFESPGAFIKNILSLEGEMIFYAFYFSSVQGEVCICNDGNAKYTLLHSLDLLDHNRGEEQDEDFRSLLYAPDPKYEAKRVPFHCYEDLQSYHAHSHESHKVVLAKFVPLGCIQKRNLEAGKDHESKQTTNDVLLWNIATKPHSLWIFYDYYTEEVEGYRRGRQLGKPTYYDEACDLEYGPQTSPFNLEANLESDVRPSQMFSHRDVSSDEYWRDDADDYELSQELSLAEPLPHCDTPSEGQKVNPGYFGIDRPFDLAVLATDINEWDGAAGLKRDSMCKCLETLCFRLEIRCELDSILRWSSLLNSLDSFLC